MEKLNEQELFDVSGGMVAGGAAGKKARIVVNVKFTGEAAKHTASYTGMKITIRDSGGPATAPLNAANGWRAVFYVKAGDTFVFDFDLRKYYPNIKHFVYNFNKVTNVVTYTLS